MGELKMGVRILIIAFAFIVALAIMMSITFTIKRRNRSMKVLTALDGEMDMAEMTNKDKSSGINTKPDSSILNRTALDATNDNQTESNILETMKDAEKEKWVIRLYSMENAPALRTRLSPSNQNVCSFQNLFKNSWNSLGAKLILLNRRHDYPFNFNMFVVLLWTL